MTDTTNFASVDAAVESLMGDPELNTVEETHVEDAEAATDEGLEEITEESPHDLLDDTEDAPEEASEDDVEDEGDDEPTDEAAIEVPEFWDAEAKEKFKSLPSDIREIVLNNDKMARTAVAKALQTAAERGKAADTEAKTLSTTRSEMEQLLDHASLQFADQYAGIEWPAYIARDPNNGPRHYEKYKQDRARLIQLKTAYEQSESQVKNAELREFWTREHANLQRIGDADPVVKKLLDPVHGAQERTGVLEYLISKGMRPEAQDHLSAFELEVSYKAYLYDKGQRALSSKKNQATPARNQNAPKMRASATPGTPQSVSRLQKQDRRLSQTHSLEDAVDLLMSGRSNANKRK